MAEGLAGINLSALTYISPAMIGKNRQLVTNEPVEVGDFKRITDHFRGIYEICLQMNEAKPEDVNMSAKPAGFRITRILTDYYAQKLTSRALVTEDSQKSLGS